LADSYFFATEQAQRLITATSVELLTLSETGNTHRDVIFEVFEALGERTWRVQWREDTRVNGHLMAQQRVSGIFSFITDTPPSQLAAEKNPLGFFITSFSLQELR
jgi:type IV secretory pathway TrbF-like protein